MDGALDVILQLKIELIGSSKDMDTNNLTHISQNWNRYMSSGISPASIEDLFTDFDHYCQIADNLVIMYK
jgi:chemotaxis regulatin CheY-phosphate phosphatase CheZ